MKPRRKILYRVFIRFGSSTERRVLGEGYFYNEMEARENIASEYPGLDPNSAALIVEPIPLEEEESELVAWYPRPIHTGPPDWPAQKGPNGRGRNRD